MNNGFDGGHCSAVFAPDYKHFGVGYWPSMSSATYLYIKNGPPRDYPIFMGSHFDETAKISEEDYDGESLHLTFMVGWHGPFGGDTEPKQAKYVYVLYQGAIIPMELSFGGSLSGIYEAHFDDPLHCEPYAFLVVTTNNETFRFPEEHSFYFGTSWIELEQGVPRKVGVDYA